ncbi:integrase, partial [Escherichia coli]|nr:integrase [Escherichia coli]
MPADPLTVAAYVAHLADTGRKPATIDLHVAAIAAAHRAGGFDN